MLAIARAIMCRPRLLLLDEPSLALQHSDRAYVLDAGVVTLEGRSADLLSNDLVTAAYLGESV